MIDLESLQVRLGVKFKEVNLLREALTHRSYLNERRDATTHNELLEFLGDAVLQLIVTDYLLAVFSDKTEGELTALRSALVSTSQLASVGDGIGLHQHLLLSKGQRSDVLTAQKRIVGCAVEAVIGAVYRDQGFAVAAELVHRILLPALPTILQQRSFEDPKSKLQEHTQAVLGITPEYKTLEERGPDHAKRFVVGVFFGDQRIAKGHGGSLKLAQTKAAEAALIIRGWNNGH